MKTRTLIVMSIFLLLATFVFAEAPKDVKEKISEDAKVNEPPITH